jgi:site-specific DNA-methyltransferase (adenine-specific)
MNQVFKGDCLKILPKIPPGSVDLIYLDPPFYTQRDHRLQTRDGAQEYSFDDTWDDIVDYRNYIADRLRECKKALAHTGSIFLHCDRSASHHLRLALDEVFGPENFQSEIIWSYRRWSNAKKGLLNSHQVIFFCSKSADFKFNPMYVDYSPTTNIDQILQERSRDGRGKAVYKTDETGQSVLMKDKKGVPLSDVWEIPYLNPKAKERVGYPTQKPILLLEKIIQLVTDEGDLVLDPFCGSGTTLVAAKLKGRRFVGIDHSKDAVKLAEQRLANPIKSESALLKKGVDAYKKQDESITQLLKRIGAVIVQRNKGIDGFVRTSDGLVPIKIQKPSETLAEAKSSLIKASQKNKYPRKLLLASSADAEPFLFDDIGDDTSSDVLVFSDTEKLIEALGLAPTV